MRHSLPVSFRDGLPSTRRAGKSTATPPMTKVLFMIRHVIKTVQCCVAALVLAASASAVAQDYPNKLVKIVVPFGAGGIADLTIRTVAQKMSESMKQTRSPPAAAAPAFRA